MTDDPLSEFKLYYEQAGFWGRLGCVVTVGRTASDADSNFNLH